VALVALSAWLFLCLSLKKTQNPNLRQAYQVQNPEHQPGGYPLLFRAVGLQTPGQTLSTERQTLWLAFPVTEPEAVVQIFLHFLLAVFACHCHGLVVVENLLHHDFLSVDGVGRSNSRYLSRCRAEVVVFALEFEAGHLLVGLVYFVGLRGWRGPYHGVDCENG
jgi:hypothetical protein